MDAHALAPRAAASFDGASDARRRTRRVALATYARLPMLADDDRLLAAALHAAGVDVAPAVWDDPAVDWTSFDLVVVRSCWDYHTRLDDFLGWVDRLERAGTRVENSPAILRWNAEKTYLRDLAARGVAVVPTRWVRAGSDATLEAILGEAGWDEVVVKPVVSASATDTWRTTRARAGADAPRFHALAARGGVMVQPFLPMVAAEGEWSLVFLDGAFSHAVLKRPAAGDFRVQHEHGGRATAVTPSPVLVRQAGAALAAAPGAPLYARVDGCLIGGRLHVMELELLEPGLFLAHEPQAAARLARAIVRRLAG
jgi:glutathione synthase/RimK-type ligase-like ATP-grasp enzyme